MLDKGDMKMDNNFNYNYNYNAPVAQEEKNGMAVAALVCGIIAAGTWIIGGVLMLISALLMAVGIGFITAIIAGVLIGIGSIASLPGTILGIIAIKKKSKKGMAVTGFVMSLIIFIITVLTVIIVLGSCLACGACVGVAGCASMEGATSSAGSAMEMPYYY